MQVSFHGMLRRPLHCTKGDGYKRNATKLMRNQVNLWFWDVVEAIFIAFGRLVLSLGISRKPISTQRYHEKWLRRISRMI